jgi:hypothetical protein
MRWTVHTVYEMGRKIADSRFLVDMLLNLMREDEGVLSVDLWFCFVLTITIDNTWENQKYILGLKR